MTDVRNNDDHGHLAAAKKSTHSLTHVTLFYALFYAPLAASSRWGGGGGFIDNGTHKA
jgi:hypothetical protein